MRFIETVKDLLFCRRCTYCGEYPTKTTAISWYYDAWSPQVRFPARGPHSSHLCKTCFPGVFDRYMGMDKFRALIEEGKKSGLFKDVSL